MQMDFVLLKRIFISLACLLFLAGTANAQTRPPPDDGSPPGYGTNWPSGPDGDGPGTAPLSDDTTDTITELIANANEFCERLPWEYRIDCLSDQLVKIARQVPATGAYRPVRLALFDAGAALADIAGASQDPQKPQIMARLDVTGGARASRPLVPVSPAAREKATREAAAVLDELSTVLLRSAENSEDRLLHYSRIARAASESGKVLLRSL